MGNRRARSLASVLALVIVGWLILSRLRFVVVVPLPWWGLLLVAVGLFLLVNYVLSKIIR